MELQLAAYAERLSAWPIETVERLLYEWPSRSKFWPTWKELHDQLPDLASLAPRITGPSGSRESFTDRVTRLKLHRRLGTIGVGRWKVIMDRHRRLPDAEVLVAVERLERGQAAFPE